MSRLDGVIILGGDGRALIQSHFRSSDALPRSHIDHFNHASSSSSSAQLTPLLWVPGIPPPSQPFANDDNNDTDELSKGKQRERNWQDALAEQGAALAHIQHNTLTFLAPLSSETNPLLPLTFLRTLLSLLAIYSGGLASVNEHAVREHFDVVYQLLEETMDDGWPLFTEASALQDLIITQSWLDRVQKVVSATGLSNIPAVPAPQATELSSIPWRRANVSHSWNEEFYADVIDSLEGVLDHQGRALSLDLFARLACRSKLSGNPEVTLSLSTNAPIAGLLTDAVLHPCVRHRKWMKERVFSFVPPDGQFELAQFRIGDPLAFPVGSAHASARTSKSGNVQMPSGGNGWERDVPLLLQTSFDVQPLEARNGDSTASSNPTTQPRRQNAHSSSGSRVEFSLTVQSKIPPNVPLENIVVSINLGPGAHSVDAAASGGGVGSGPEVSTPTSNLTSSLMNSGGQDMLKTMTDAFSTTVAALGTGAVVHSGGKSGAWVFDQGSSMLRWEILRLGSAAERPATLKGSFMTSDMPVRIASGVRTTFSIPNHSLSQVRVGSVQVAGEGPSMKMFKGLKVFKGIRTVVEGDLEWRRF
ncbi:unnamed protein product [Tilletia laevis]|uniref:MHD domain-containing protein n=3 Tax=Tilletia TaxID=13289 RepID=A0A8X7MP71_9BASI|nr:hypothetical protein CF336_g6067 [Tilletia laevis]KAE8191072.1 hypothetical protein CF328_g5790 [Tilletia controversa]KAE8256459.1 hypothetical protein A4X03_0g5384 [Tilletia caries]KAE8194354.1 hypothetical protein CF335_g5364 [Tilletia laevis]KAE8242881.1 hypothetical protein A4X06_0g6706 [Tilletia controversa]